MAHTLSNKCTKNLCKRTVLLQLIIKNVVTCFLEHSVDLSSIGQTPSSTDSDVSFILAIYDKTPAINDVVNHQSCRENM